LAQHSFDNRLMNEENMNKLKEVFDDKKEEKDDKDKKD